VSRRRTKRIIGARDLTAAEMLREDKRRKEELENEKKKKREEKKLSAAFSFISLGSSCPLLPASSFLFIFVPQSKKFYAMFKLVLVL